MKAALQWVTLGFVALCICIGIYAFPNLAALIISWSVLMATIEAYGGYSQRRW